MDRNATAAAIKIYLREIRERLEDCTKTAKVAELGSDGTTSVVAGVAAGTRLVSNGQMSLGDGEKVPYRQ